VISGCKFFYSNVTIIFSDGITKFGNKQFNFSEKNQDPHGSVGNLRR